MPWTSLERHSDLKAAVEDFAPATHPIRKYLSLLGKLKRFEKALNLFLERVRKDPNVLAAVLVGRLTEETIWRNDASCAGCCHG